MMATITVAQKTTLKIKFSSQSREVASEKKACSHLSVDRSWSSCSSLVDNSYESSASNKRARPNPAQCQTKIKLKMDRSMSQQCSAIVKSLIHEPEGWVFKIPVDPIKLGIPDYFSIIKKPMDLGTIKSKLDKNLYNTTEEFVSDVHMTFSNATLYNPPTNSVHQMAKRLDKVFELRWASLIDQYQTTQFKNSRSKLHTVVAEQINAQEQSGSKTSINKIRSLKKSSKPWKPKAGGRSKTSQIEVLGFTKKNPVIEVNCDPSISCGLDSKMNCDVNLKVSKSDQESDASALSEEVGSLNAARTVTPEASSTKDWKSPCCETPLSPTKALRAAMLKQRFAETILKAQQKTLNTQPDASDTAKIRVEKEQLEKKQREERARIEAQLKAAEAASRMNDEIQIRNRLKREREEARVALQKVEKTAGIERNVEIVMELEMLCGGALVYSPRGMGCDDVENPLRQLGLFIKDDSCDYDEDVDMDEEEGEILL